MTLPTFFRILWLLLFAGTNSFAQSLADVLSSIQERKQAVEQSKQVNVHLIRKYLNSTMPIPEQTLIDWEGLGSAFPTDAEAVGLGIDARINLLNQAIRELRALQPQFLNFRKEDLTANGQAGALRHFMLEDFPDPGRIGVTNYHALLRITAQSVRRLSVLPWPIAGFQRNTYKQASSEQPIPSIGPGEIEEYPPEYEIYLPGWQIGNSHQFQEESIITGTTYTDEGVGENDTYYVSKSEKFYDKLALFAGVPQVANQLQGKVAAVARNNWTNIPDASVNVSAPETWKTGQNGACIVTLVEDNPSGEFATAGPPQITVQLAWGEVAWMPMPPYVYPAGSNLDPLGFYGENSWEEALLDVVHAPWVPWDFKHLVLSRRITGVFAPSFSRGLDASGKAVLLDQAEETLASPPGDAHPMLHPSPGMLMAIPLGVGLDGGINGYIGITPGESSSGLIRYSSERLFSAWRETQDLQSPPDINPSSSELAYRFDYAASLRFIGPVQDFHVVYETSREEDKRGAALPPEVPTTQQITDMGCRFFFRNWDLPRLKQVVSRDFIVNITPQGHYKNEVKIYRRPANAGAVDRTPGEIADVDEANLIRTLALENPDATNNPYPDTPEKLHITDANTLYKIERTGYPQFAWKIPSGFGVNYPDIHFEIEEGNTVRYAKTMDFQGIGHVTTATSVDGVTVSTETINDQDWAWYLGMEPSNRTIVRGSQTTAVTSTHAANPTPWESQFRKEWHPLTTHITTTNEPDTDLAWNASGRLISAVQGSWRMDCTIESGALKAESKFNNIRYATTWTEWSNGDRTVKTYQAPEGAVTSKSANAVDWTELTLGNANGTGLPGLPHTISSKDGTGSSYTWNVGNDHSGSLTVAADTQTTSTSWNNRNYTISSQTSFMANGTVTVSHHEVPSGQTTTWGAPIQWNDLLTNLSSGIAYAPGLNRPSSVTTPLGLTTEFSNYDIFNRPGQVTSNGITATNIYTTLSTTTTYSGTGVAPGSQSSYASNIEGTDVSTGMIWGGVSQSQSASRTASTTTFTGTNSLLGASSATVRNADGSLNQTDSPTLAFGGIAGDALSIVNGLFVTKTAVADVPGTFAETHTDAWGRVHKILTPSKSSGNAQTSFDYSDPSSALKRIITTEPTGRILITESEANGTVTRSGIDVNGNGALGTSDRYTESITTVESGKIVTTLSLTEDSGMREILKTEITPSTGVTITKINGNEETITTTPNYTGKTVTTSSTRGWIRTTGVNNLGLATSNNLTGTGIPTTGLAPTWRADGSLESVALNIGGEMHTASFNPDSTLASLTAPGRGNILGQHSISNGVETLAVDGVTTETSLDGTSHSISGANVIAKVETLATAGGGYKKTVTPAIGAPTETAFNAATAQTSKTYADSSSENYGYTGELLSSISLARGGALALDYSNDGAKDLTSATWPAIASGPFTIPGIAHGYGHNRSGNIDSLTDPSGTRSLNYQNGRLSGTTYTAGLLQGYEILLGRDTVGRHTGTEIKRDGTTIHTTAKAPNGASDQITNLASGNITATPQRDGAGRVTGYIWSDGTNFVTQTWTRGAGGRIEFAGSDVSGAPSFDYLIDPNNPAESFDAFGRRLKCQTAGGEWTYVYGLGGQLSSATHPTLGTFTYSFDGIGRRTDKGSANTSDILNRTIAWTHSQNKTLTINAHPDARVWFNGVEIPSFTGSYQSAITPPGAEGGWVPWETLAILEGQGEGAGNPPTNPNASPDAKAEKRGAVWVPPVAETFTFDAAGNRESSAQWDYGWDAKNQLARVRTKNHATAPQAYDINFTYDSEGRRVKKHVVEYQSGDVVSEKIITFVWDGWDLLYERHQLPSGLTLLERKYLWGPDIADGQAGGAGGLLLIRETKGSTTTEIIPLYDGTGHVVALTDINKNLLAEYAYGPFGEKIHATGPLAQSNPWRYATKYLDDETGLYYFGHRYFDPITGQWLSREPLGESESVNLYSYCHNDPVNHVDVLGLAKIPLSQANKQLIELALRYGLINQDAGDDASIDLAVLNSLLIANGDTPIDFLGGRITIPCTVCHGSVAGRRLPGVSLQYSLVGGKVHSSTGNADMMQKIAAGAWGNARAMPGELINFGASAVNGISNAVGEFTGFESGTHPAFYEAPIDADGWRQAGQQQVYPGINSDNLLVGSGGAISDAVFLFAAPEALLAKAPGWSVKLAPRLNPANYKLLPAFNTPLFGLPQFVYKGERKAVLLGEFMPRVRAGAAANPGFRVWPARNWDNWVAEGVEREKNLRWLQDQIRSGADIYSLGKTPGFSRGTYFRDEVTEMLRHGYRRRSAGTINIPGFGDVPLYHWVKQ